MLLTRVSVYIAQVFINIVFVGGWWDHQWPDSAHILINYGKKFSFLYLIGVWCGFLECIHNIKRGPSSASAVNLTSRV
jgi:hypothetical protein